VIRRVFPTSEPDVLKRFTEQFSMTYWFYALLFRRLLYKSPEKTQHMFAVITTGCADLTWNNHSSTSKRQNAIFWGLLHYWHFSPHVLTVQKCPILYLRIPQNCR